ncbi:MAG: N-acetylmuramoyl-L-alanine amidase [Alphaproteobacteria bacterium]|nr:N-acetylmuramoyl-L-alanine amidase [Alphaproteobacteria bacterium]
MIDAPSPNHDARSGSVDMLVLHYTGMETAEAALAWMRDPASQVSAHYLVDEAGTVTRLVDEAQRAWHAGTAAWRHHRDINARSIGIELANPGHEFGYRNFPATQITTVEELARNILDRHAIPARNVVGHADVAPARKADPGERFPWERLAAAGIGLWPDVAAAPLPTEGLASALRTFGYDPSIATTGEIVTAFQRHFRPALVDGIADDETRERLAALVEMVAPAASTP